MIRQLSGVGLLLIAISLVFPVQSMGAISDSEQKITPGDPGASNYFGQCVSVDANYLIAGASGARAAYVFEKNGGAWTQMAKLDAPSNDTGDKFGASVAISGDYAVVGAWEDALHGTRTGAAYVFQRDGDTWGNPVTIRPADAKASAYFGRAVSISGDYVLIGARGDSGTGAAYVFERIDGNWTEVAKLVSDDITSNDRFGRSVSISGTHAVVGADGDDDNYNSSGSAYVFERIDGVWVQTDKLKASDPCGDSYFGRSVAMGDGFLVVGAPFAPYGNTLPCHDHHGDGLRYAGQVYLFERTENGWMESQILIASDQTARQQLSYYFGLSISGDYILAGAYDDRTQGAETGAAYVFKRDVDEWTEIEKILASDAAADDHFGAAVAISGPDIIIGAFRDDANNLTNSGAVYAYQIWSCQSDMDQDGDADGDDLWQLADAFDPSDPSCLGAFAAAFGR